MMPNVPPDSEGDGNWTPPRTSAAPPTPPDQRIRAVAALVLLLSVMLLGGGFAEGLTNVTVADGTSCGSSFSPADHNFDLTEGGNDACAAATSEHRPSAVALLIAGGIGLIGAFIAWRTAAVHDPDPGAPAPAAPPGEFPPPAPGLYGHKD